MGRYAVGDAGRQEMVRMTRVLLAERVRRDGQRLDEEICRLMAAWDQWNADEPPATLPQRWAAWMAQGRRLRAEAAAAVEQARRYRVRAAAVLARAYGAGLIAPVPSDEELVALAQQWMAEREPVLEEVG